MVPIDLNEETFTILTMKAYDKPNYILSEYEEDLKRLKYIKRLIRKYHISGELKERLLLNHIIILANIFGIEYTVRVLFYKLEPIDYPVLKTILLFLNYMPTIVYGINGKDIHSGDITIDLKVGKSLREL